MSCDKTARIIIKLGQGVPTIPVSTDHRNGDWIATDIYEGEQYMDTNTGLVYTRNGSTIETISGGGSVETAIIGSISQSSTSAPTLVIGKNNTGATITPSRVSTGEYLLTASAPVFTAGGTFPIIAKPGNSYDWTARIGWDSTTEISITTNDGAGVVSDGILDGTTFAIHIF
jgi:hypothetical protein